MWVPSSVRQLVLLVREWASIRMLLLNRFVLIVVVVAVAAGGGQAYVAANSGNVIDGTVVDADGEPVQNAEVVLSAISLRGVPSKVTTTTNEIGEFEFANYNERGQATLEFRIWAIAPDGTKSTEYRHHVSFPRESRTVTIRFDESID